jgi:hypothetical protein
MFRIRRFGVMKTATLVAVLYMLVIAIIVVPITVIVALARSADSAGGAIGFLLLGLLAAVFYGLAGWVFTAISCLLYNVAAGWVGGIEVQVEAVAPATPAPAWGPTGTPPTPPSRPTWGSATPPSTTPPTDRPLP